MAKRINLVLLNLFLSFFAFAKTTNLEEALRQKWVSATIVMQENEATQGRNLRVSLKNLRKEPLTVNIPVGFVFQATDTTVQDFIHLENKDVPLLASGTKSVFIKASCIRASRSSPHNGDAFLATTLASSPLLALTTFAFQQKLYNLDAMQSALWAVSDNHDLTGIYQLELAKFVAQLLNKPLPDYFVAYKNRDIAGETAARSLEPMTIKGVFEYTLPADQQVQLDLVNTEGVSALQKINFVQVISQTKGQHRFTYTLKLHGVPRGTYFVKMTDVNGGKEWASKQVVF